MGCKVDNSLVIEINVPRYVVHQTNGREVYPHQMGHLRWLLLNAARVRDPGNDPIAARN